MPGPVRVMFVCTGNSARSQMAEGFVRYIGRGRIEACSAGMEPSQLNPFAVTVMQEKGVDISGQRSKGFDEALARRMDVVVTVCGNADERCPILPPEVTRLHWPLEDPAAAQGTEAEILSNFREIRDQIEARVQELVRTLDSSNTEGLARDLAGR
ncbi:MAG: arsenate reductase ArsC [Candidatus Methylomirabilales bacterium]